MGKNTPGPDAAVLSSFATAAAETARGNLEAPKCLLEGRHLGQARSIAVIAFEEAGKAFLSTIAMLVPGEMQQEFPWGDLGWDHKGKLSAAHTMHVLLALLRGDTGRPAELGGGTG